MRSQKPWAHEGEADDGGAFEEPERKESEGAQPE
jgi:hypothetical protein